MTAADTGILRLSLFEQAKRDARDRWHKAYQVLCADMASELSQIDSAYWAGDEQPPEFS